MEKSEIIKFLILRTIGNFLVLFAVFGIFATFGPALYYEFSFRIANARGVTYVVASNDQLPNPQPSPIATPGGEFQPSPRPPSIPEQSSGVDNFAQVLAGPKEQILVPKDTEFSIVIPKIGASAKVYPNVDAFNEKDFLPILAKGVAHAKGTVFPGNIGNIYLFAHSTDNFWDVGRYNAVFYLLKDLSPGDEIVVFFHNKRYDYIVSSTKIVDPSSTSYITQAQKQKTETLILQTCWPPGTTWQRLLVFAKPK